MGKSFSEFNSDRTNLMVVDGLNLAFRFKHANKKIFATEYYDLIASLARSYDARDVIVLGDGGSAYRKEIYPEYKANRAKLKEEQTKEEAEEFLEFLVEFDRTMEHLSASYITLKFKGVEADDIAAYLAQKLQDSYEHIWLISSDKDWDLLISDKVSRFSYRTRKETTTDTWADQYAYAIDDHISIKVLMGDKGDNVPGIVGVGEKRAYNILREFGPTAFDVHAALPINKPQQFIQNLNKFKDNIFLNYELMDLPTYCEEAIGIPNLEIIDGKTKNCM